MIDFILSLVVVSSFTTEVTAYNLGDTAQTDSTPCIGASGENLCKQIEQKNICATNKYELGTKLYIEGLGFCVVKDRMNSRYKNRVDWAMPKGDHRSMHFGVKDKKVYKLKLK